MLSNIRFCICLWFTLLYSTLGESLNSTDFLSLEDHPSRVYFNIIDKVHEILEDDKGLSKSVPSCVVVGMQSVGKSAILSRISGIKFPQDSEVCTRVPIELRLRRVKKRNQEDTIRPMTVKAGNSDPQEVDKTDDKAVEEVLAAAQKEVLDGKDFEDKLSVKIDKEDFNLPDFTLVDLPGIFFAKDVSSQDLEEKVKNMVAERVRNDMTLILHVVPLNQDTDTISTWRVVHDADRVQERTISVLTKADLALKDGRDLLKKRLQKVTMDSNSAQSFVVHGLATDTEEEESQLAMVSDLIEDLGLGDRIKVGINELNIFIENRMLEHIKEKVPDVRALLENELGICEQNLKVLGRHPISPNSIALSDSQSMTSLLAEAFASIQPKYRRFTEQMSTDLKEIRVKSLDIIDEKEANEKLQKKTEHPTCSPSFDVTKVHYYFHQIAQEVKFVGENNRSMINIPYVGKKLELKTWILQAFIDPMNAAIQKYIDDIFDAFYNEVFKPAIAKGSSQTTKIAARHVEKLIGRNVVFATKKAAIEYATYLVDSVKDNTFTSNYDTYQSLSQDCLSSINKEFTCIDTSEIKMHFEVVCGLVAFFEIRTRVLSDTVQLHFMKVLKDLLKETEKEIWGLMMSQKILETINESSHTLARRKFYLKREKKIKKALEEIHLL